VGTVLPRRGCGRPFAAASDQAAASLGPPSSHRTLMHYCFRSDSCLPLLPHALHKLLSVGLSSRLYSQPSPHLKLFRGRMLATRFLGYPRASLRPLRRSPVGLSRMRRGSASR